MVTTKTHTHIQTIVDTKMVNRKEVYHYGKNHSKSQKKTATEKERNKRNSKEKTTKWQ